jgi:putative peptide zinc metalloprotease protein
VLLSGVFHEFGHAAALRYGGGKVRGMGWGLYLIYPAFYTDVTDSYRLGRWAKIRTDIGGVYFHLIFAVGLIALGLASGKELLFFAALLINLRWCASLFRLCGSMVTGCSPT